MVDTGSVQPCISLQAGPGHMTRHAQQSKALQSGLVFIRIQHLLMALLSDAAAVTAAETVI